MARKRNCLIRKILKWMGRKSKYPDKYDAIEGEFIK
jgi:hypothetical protein